MSLAVKLVSLTMASVGESEVGAGAGVGAGWAAASPGLVGAACFEAFEVVRAAERGRRFCATALKHITSASNKTKGDLRFIKCIFLTAGASCQPRLVVATPASLPTVSSVSISSAVLSGRSLTMRGKRKA